MTSAVVIEETENLVTKSPAARVVSVIAGLTRVGRAEIVEIQEAQLLALVKSVLKIAARAYRIRLFTHCEMAWIKRNSRSKNSRLKRMANPSCL